jgi:hypothetical protein
MIKDNYQCHCHKAYRSLLFSCLIMLLFTQSNCNKIPADIRSSNASINLAPDLHVIQIADLDSYTKTSFISNYSLVCPGIVTGDFDGNGLYDIGLLTINSDKTNNMTLVILLQNHQQHFTTAYTLQIDKAYYGNTFIIPCASGKTISQTKAIDSAINNTILKYDSIELMYFEKASIVLYWDENRGYFASIQPSD